MDLLAYFSLRSFHWLLNCLPVEKRIHVVALLLRLMLFLRPRLVKVAHRNIKLAFPGKSESWRKEFLDQCIISHSRAVVDVLRLPTVDEDWIARNVDHDFLEQYAALKARYPNQGFMMASGHFGSFELLAHILAVLGMKLDFVMRPFKLKRVDAWWNALRQLSGNRSIQREGAFKDSIRTIKSGRNVGVLFDQNVTRKNAVFVDWFGKAAATTKLIAVMVMRFRTPVIVISMTFEEGKYRIHYKECDCNDLVDDESLEKDEKLKLITQRVADEFQGMILASAHEWFWVHRRWKTTEDGVETFYTTDLLEHCS